MPTDLETIPQAAKRWGVSQQLAGRWRRKGYIPQAVLVGYVWCVPTGLPRPAQAVTWAQHKARIQAAAADRKAAQ